MQRLCDFCGQNHATLVDKKIINNGAIEYHFCDVCYKSIIKSGMSTFDTMQALNARLGWECERCGLDAEGFQKTFLFGCCNCYSDMGEVAKKSIISAQGGAVRHIGKKIL